MSRYYIKTGSAHYIEAYKSLRAMAAARFRFLKQKAVEWGFDEFGAQDFSACVYFFKLCEPSVVVQRKGPEIEGFKSGERVYQQGAYYYRYELRQNNKRATAMRKEIKEGLPPLPDELAGRLGWIRPSISAAFCARFGLPDGVFHGNCIGYGQVVFLHESLIACSLPYRDDGSKDAVPAVFPEGFEEITERALDAEISAHNAALDARQGKGPGVVE